METEDDLCQNNWGRSSSKLREPGNQTFTGLTTSNQKWEEASILDYEMEMEPPSLQVFQQMKASGLDTSNSNSNSNSNSQINVDFLQGVRAQAWDPRTMLNNLSFMEQKIHQLQDLVHLLVGRNGGQQQQQLQGSRQDDELVAQQQQQLITTDLTSIIIQLISTAGSLLPSVKHNMSTAPGPFTGQPGGSSAMFPYPREANNVASQTQNVSSCCRGVAGDFDLPKQQPPVAAVERESHVLVEDHEMKDEDDAEEGENLPPGSYEILQLEKEEILAPHTHFCTICGKGFKRDANLRMHMRGHGDEYKTPAALAKPNKEALPGSEPMLIKRYSCPFPGCKRNKEHKKFQPLKTILCVKNHYKRTHCDKSFTCSRCHTKKFSVIADLKTHEKHCGKNKWLCSCGTTFSRKDKLFGHIALFQGHTPAIPLEDTKPSAVASTQRENYSESENNNNNNNNNNAGMVGFDLSSATNGNPETAQQQPGFMEGKISFEESFSPLSFDTCNFGGFHEFPRPMFDDSESSFQMLISSACGFSPRNNGCGSVSNTSL